MIGCGGNSTSKDKVEAAVCDSDAVCIAVQPTFESMPLIVAEESGIFDSCGIKVNLRLLNSQADCDMAVASGSADGMITDVVRGTFWENENKKKLNFATYTNTHFMLVSSKKARVKELSQMTDKLIAVTRNSVTDVLADSAIQRAGKTPEEMFKVQINNQEIRLNMLLENKMDAAFLQHPYAAEAIAKGGSVLMHGGKSCSGVVAFNTSVAQKDIDVILKAYDEACDTLNKNGIAHYAPVIEKYMRKDIREWKKEIGKIKFRHSQPVSEDVRKKAGQWLENN